MGNGQCPECCGHPPHWLGHLCVRNESDIGHELDCYLAAAIKDAGGSVIFLGEYVNTPDEEEKYKTWRDHYRKAYEYLRPSFERIDREMFDYISSYAPGGINVEDVT